MVVRSLQHTAGGTAGAVVAVGSGVAAAETTESGVGESEHASGRAASAANVASASERPNLERAAARGRAMDDATAPNVNML